MKHEPELDERFYPVTEVTDWGPLIDAGHDPGGWMFMEAYTNGQRNYKHFDTRETLILPKEVP